MPSLIGGDHGLRRLSAAAAGWALFYAAYRAYYGFGGRFAIIGVPADEGTWRAINLVAAGLLLGAAILPLVALPLWKHPWRGARCSRRHGSSPWAASCTA